MSLSHEGYASHCRSTELYEDLVVVADLPRPMVRHHKTILHMDEYHDMIVRSSLVDSKMSFI